MGRSAGAFVAPLLTVLLGGSTVGAGVLAVAGRCLSIIRRGPAARASEFGLVLGQRVADRGAHVASGGNAVARLGSAVACVGALVGLVAIVVR